MSDEPLLRTINEAHRACLMHGTAELLAVPVRLCPRRRCRRKRRCDFVMVETGEPWCLAEMSDEQRQVYDALLAAATAAWEVIMGLHEPYPSGDPVWRETQDAAVEIAVTVLSDYPPNRPRVRGWLQRRRDNEPALLDGAKLEAVRAHIDSLAPSERAILPYLV